MQDLISDEIINFKYFKDGKDFKQKMTRVKLIRLNNLIMMKSGSSDKNNRKLKTKLIDHY